MSHIAMCQCRPGFLGKQCEEEAQWIEFKSPSSWLRFTTPVTFDNTRDLETLFVLPTNGRPTLAQVASVLTNNENVCLHG